MFADSQSHPDVKFEDGVEAKRQQPHLVFKFHDLPPWRPYKTGNKLLVSKVRFDTTVCPLISDHDKRHNSITNAVTVDLRRYNPLTAQLLAQSYVYPASNGLTQTDRGR